MSYSFSVKGVSKAEALQKVADEMDKVVVGQPVHAKDAEAVKVGAATFVGFLEDDDKKDVVVSVSGSLAWQAEGLFTSASVSIYASLQQRA